MSDELLPSAPDDPVLHAIESGVLTLTLNRPERKNALTLSMQSRYFDLLEAADVDPQVRAIVVTGADGHFCPGFDMEQLSRAVADAKTSGAGAGRRPFDLPLTIRKPVVAAVEGSCAGIGLLMALQTDVRFVARGARISTAYARRGLAAEYGVSWLLSRVTRWDHAADLLISGRKIDGEEAVRLGVGTHLTEDGDALTCAIAYAHELAEHCAPTAMAAIKMTLRRDQERTYRDGWEHAAAVTDQLLAHDDAHEGVRSFIERRPPAFAPLDPHFALADTRPAPEAP